MSNLPTEVKVTDGTNDLAIDGSGNITVNLSGAVQVTDGTDTLQIDASGRIAVSAIASALPAGTNNIGDVDVLTLPAITGTVAVSSVGAGTANIGKVVPITSVGGEVAGSAAWVGESGIIGLVGYDSVGDVGPLRTDSAGRLLATLTQPASDTPIVYADPTFTTKYGLVAMGIYPGDGLPYALQVADDGMLNVAVMSLPSLPAGTNNIGDVDVASIAAGTNRIGKVNITDDSHTLLIPKSGDTVGANPEGVIFQGVSGTTAYSVRVDASGELQVDVNNAIDISDDFTRQLGTVKVGDGTDTLLVNADGSALVDLTDDFTRQLGIVKIGDGTDTVDVVTSGGAIGAGTGGIIPFGSDSGTARPVHVDTAGDLQVDVLTLPATAATTTKQDTIIGHLDGVEGLLTTIDADTGTLAGAVSGSEMQVDVVTLPTKGGKGSLVRFYPIVASSSGDTTLVAADANSRIKVISYVLVCKNAVDIKFIGGTTDLTGVMALPANGILSAVGNVTSHLFETVAINEALKINLASAVQVGGHICVLVE